MTCTHDIIEKDNACADGMCPICLAAKVERLESICQQLQIEMDKLLKQLRTAQDPELRYFGEIPL